MLLLLASWMRGGGGLRGYKGDRIINGIYFMKSEKLIQQNVRLVYVNV